MPEAVTPTDHTKPGPSRAVDNGRLWPARYAEIFALSALFVALLLAPEIVNLYWLRILTNIFMFAVIAREKLPQMSYWLLASPIPDSSWGCVATT